MPKNPRLKSQGQNAAVKIVGLYALFASAWILFSDRFVLGPIHDPKLLLLLSMTKGWFFVLVTSLLLYALVSGELRRRSILEAELRARVLEKEVLLREVHHRVKNNLQIVASILNLERDFIETGADRRIFDETRARIHSMALVHELLYTTGDISKVELSEYLERLAVEATTAMGARAELSLNLERMEAGLDLALPCGLIVAEALANAIHHGGGKGLRVSLRREGSDRVLLELRDSGPGFPNPDILKSGAVQSSGIGFRLMEALSRQIDGTLETANEEGAVLRLRFPSIESIRTDPQPLG